MSSRARTARGGLLQPPSWAGFLRVLPPGLGLSLAVLYLVAVQPDLSRNGLTAFLQRSDYPSFLTGARLIAAGQGAHLYDPVAQTPVQVEIVGAAVVAERGLLPYNHLPFLALALAPVAGWPVAASYALWMAASLLALAGALALLTGELLAYAGPRPLRHIPTIWAAVGLWGLAAGFFPLFESLLAAQVTVWVLLGFTGALWALRTGHDVTGGLALGLGLLKPQLVIVPLLVLLVLRRWRALAGFAGLAAAGLLGGVLVLGGVGWVPDYVALLGQVAGATGSGAIQPVLMANWRGFLALLALYFAPGPAPGGTPAWVLPVALALGAVTVLGLLIAWLRRGWRPAPPGATTPDAAARAGDLRWAATILVALLVSPHLPNYELTLWLLPGVLAWRALRPPPFWILDFGNPGDLNPKSKIQNPKSKIGQFRLPVLIGGYLAGVLALPLAGASWLQVGALAMIVGVPLLLWLAAMQENVDKTISDAVESAP